LELVDSWGGVPIFGLWFFEFQFAKLPGKIDTDRAKWYLAGGVRGEALTIYCGRQVDIFTENIVGG
jgi:hypothetical protein